MTLETNLINIVLIDTIHPGNIGSVARAMKTMGLQRLSLVNPRVFPSGESTALAGNATDVLENATIFDSIKDAIKDSTFVYATSARDRSIQWPIMNAEQAANNAARQTRNVAKKAGRKARKFFSDIRLKTNIERVGTSASGINIYKFNEIGRLINEIFK